MTALLEVERIKKHFPVGSRLFARDVRKVRAVDDVSFELKDGETFALVGESGCGKSTVGRAVLRLFDLTDGTIKFDGKRIDNLAAAPMHAFRKHIQLVFQDPFSSLNPRMRIREILAEPIRNFRLASDTAELERRIKGLLQAVRLPASAADRWPHEFSGGQRQRIGIARALASEPKLIVCDEAVSALDVSVKAQIVNLLQDLQRSLGLSILFISHDLAVVEHIADRVAVMYLGRIVELAPKRQLFAAPRHPYTEALLSAVPVPQPSAARKRIPLPGELPSPMKPPAGCHFHTRCPLAFELCRVAEPQLREVATGQHMACHLDREVRQPINIKTGERT